MVHFVDGEEAGALASRACALPEISAAEMIGILAWEPLEGFNGFMYCGV